MAKVEHAKLSVTQGGNWFVFTLDWRCSFVPEETNFVFDTNWSLMEDDGGGGDDDFITSDVSPHVHSAHSDVKQFRPVAAHPTNDPRSAIFQETRQWHRSNVDTELFEGEEIYAFVHLRNVTQDFFTPGLRSNTLDLNP